MDLTKSNARIQILFMAYNVILAGIWVLRAPQVAVMPFMVFLHGGLAFLFLGLPTVAEGSHAAGRVLSRLYPYLIWALAWSEIGWLYKLTQPVVHDGTIMSLDLALFGFHLNEKFATVAPWGPVRHVMGLAYLSYYLLILGPPVVLAAKGRARELEDHTFGLIFTYLVCFVIYLILPVVGPRELAQAAAEVAPAKAGLFGPMMKALFEAGDSLGTAFPSSHCAASVAAALLVHRHFGRAAGRLYLVWAGFIVVSTVYTNNHYLIDATAGVAVAAVTWKLVAVGEAWSVRKTVPARRPLAEKELGLSGPQVTESKGGMS